MLLEEEFAVSCGTAYTSVLVAVIGAGTTADVAIVVTLTAAGAGITAVGIGVKIYQARQDQKLNYDTIIQ